MGLRIDLRQLECFVAVAEEGSFRAAAERLDMSQPPLSRQIQQLEAELRVPLLVRDLKGASLTLAGRMFLAEARKTLVQAGAAVDAVRRFADKTSPRLRVGYTTVFDPEVFPALEPGYRKAVPDGSLEFTSGTSVELIRRLRRGTLDVALIGLPSDTGDLVVEPLHREPLVAVVPAGHSLALRKILSLDLIADQPLFWPRRRMNPGFYDYCEQVFEKLGFAPRKRLPEPKDHHALLAEVARGRGIGFVPSSMNKIRRAGTTLRPLREKELWVGFGVAYKEGRSVPGLDVFLDLVRRKRRLQRRNENS
jgi:DNA-binding transcriptional LysR family regulator